MQYHSVPFPARCGTVGRSVRVGVGIKINDPQHQPQPEYEAYAYAYVCRGHTRSIYPSMHMHMHTAAACLPVCTEEKQASKQEKTIPILSAAASHTATAVSSAYVRPGGEFCFVSLLVPYFVLFCSGLVWSVLFRRPRVVLCLLYSLVYSRPVFTHTYTPSKHTNARTPWHSANDQLTCGRIANQL